jgi:hypothetical protein
MITRMADQLAELRAELDKLRDARIDGIERMATENDRVVRNVLARVSGLDAKVCIGGAGVGVVLAVLEVVLKALGH